MQQRFRAKVVSLLPGGVLVAVLFLFCWFVFHEQGIERPESLAVTTAGKIEMCLFCHGDVELDPAHDAKVIGCSSCHLGNPLAVEKDAAHVGMVLNPGDLRVVDKSCGISGCHPVDVHNVKNSLMATNRGIISTLLYYWGEADNQNSDLTVEKLIESGQNSFALDYFRKLCASCHLWKKRFDMAGAPLFFNEKGGGCTACHLLQPGDLERERRQILNADDKEIWWPPAKGEMRKKRKHPLISKKVSSVKCVRCHNRSGRIGTSYFGAFELLEGDDSVATEKKKPLPGGRFYLELADDIHHRAGLECIDCHLQQEIMGDGISYAHYEEQLEITCESCHGGGDGALGFSSKGRKLNNLQQKDGKILLQGKVSNKVWQVKEPKKGVCDFPAHRRVSCEACHSPLVPQCYGCHVSRDKSEKHLDKLSLKETPGLWEEETSYIRNEQPMLGVWNDEIVIMTPGCQDMVTVEDEDGEIEASFNRFTMAAINPHTTQATGRRCVDCHDSTKTVGLGEGEIREKDRQLIFIAKNSGLQTEAGITMPLDAYVNLAGEALQHSARRGLRPFDAKELRAILQVGRCVRCHDRYDDPLWKIYSADSSCPETKKGEVPSQP